MKTDFDFDGRYLASSTVFRPDFNNFQEISATEAWSMFFTASNDRTALGNNPELGGFFTNLLIAIVVAGAVGSLAFFNSII